MKSLPKTENPVILRVDFSNQTAWDEICRIIRKPVGIFRFRANVEFIDDAEYADITGEQLLGLLPTPYNHTFIIIVDRAASLHPEHPLLVVNLFESSGQEFRAIPSQVQGIENNLSIANMDFEEFAGAVDRDGVFRGFPRS